MRRPDRPAGYEQAAMSATARRNMEPGRLPATLAELLWSGLVMVVPLGTGLAVNIIIGLVAWIGRIADRGGGYRRHCLRPGPAEAPLNAALSGSTTRPRHQRFSGCGSTLIDQAAEDR